MHYPYGSSAFSANFLDGNSAKSMSVNGSVSSKLYTYSPGSGCVLIDGFSCLFKDEGTTSFDKFGALTRLTNGVLIEVTINNITTTISNLRDNGDLSTRFYFNQFGNGAVLSILSIVSPQGFGNTNNVLVGRWQLQEPFIIQDSDVITITIRDNLSTIDIFEMALSGVHLL